MAYNKDEVKPVTVYVPHEILDEIKRFHQGENRPRMKMSAMIVNILQRWYDERLAAAHGKKGVAVANRRA